MIDGNSAAEREYEERYRQYLEILACDEYTDPSSDYVCDAMSNDDSVRKAWKNLMNCYTNDSEELLASCAREFITSMEDYVKSCPEIIYKSEMRARG